MIAVDTALLDRHLFGAALGSSPDTWATWLTVLRAAFASPLDRRDKTTFTKIAGPRKPPQQRVRELCCAVGMRSGKSRMAGALAVYQACFVTHKLARGETGYVLVLSPTLAQAKMVFVTR
jgi:hypothetical protein